MAVWLYAVLASRILVDLLWGLEGRALGLELLEAFGAAVVMGAALLAWSDRRRILGHPFAGWALAFGIVSVLAAARAPDQRTGIEHLARWVGPPLLMLVASLHLRSERDRRILLAIVPLVGMVPVGLGLAAWATGQAEVLHGAARVRGAYANVHHQAHAMALLAAFGTFWAVADEPERGTGARRALALGFAALCGFLLVQTWVRTALLGFGAFLVVFAALERRWGVLVLVGLVAVGLGTTEAAQARFADLAPLLSGRWLTPHELDHLGSSRGYLWLNGIAGWLDRPWHELALGMGLEQHRTLDRDGLDPHSDLLALLFQAGPVAPLTWLAFQWLVFRRALRLRATGGFSRTFGSFLIGLDAAVLLTNALSNSYASRLHIGWTFWILGGALIAVEIGAKHRLERE